MLKFCRKSSCFTRLPARLPAVLIAVSLLAGVSCARSAELTISAAASLSTAFTALQPLFEAAHPDSRLRLNTAASGVLLQQIVRGAPVDVFASADETTMDRAQAHLKIGSRRNFASNALVVVVPGSRMRMPNVPNALADLATPSFARIAIGVPASVPAGRYAQQALQAAGLWAAVEAKMVGAQSVRQALDYTARGEVDAAFVYATDAALLPGKVHVALRVPTTGPVRYPIAVLAASREPALAQAFVDFVLSPPAQAVLARHGFGPP